MRIALGTAQFGMAYGIGNQAGQVAKPEIGAILKLAASEGIDTLDTAVAYGESEQQLGDIGVCDWRVVSKLPPIPADDLDNPRAWIDATVAGCLARLHVPALYGLLLHYPQQLLSRGGSELYGALQRLKRDGLVQKIGVSIYSPAELDALYSHYEFDLIQAPLNPLDQRLIDTGWMSRLASTGTEIHVRSVFLQGLLLLGPDKRPKKFSQWASLWSSWDNWLEQSKQSALQACLRYALSFPQISRVVVGVDNEPQLRQIIRATGGASHELPVEIKSEDVDLINPAKWSKT